MTNVLCQFSILTDNVLLPQNKIFTTNNKFLSKTQGRYRKGPLSQRSAHAEQYVQTKTNTNPNPDPNRYSRRCPDPNARIQKFMHYMAIAAICDSGPLR